MNTQPDGRHLAFPFRVGSDGRLATPPNPDAHLRDELLQLILTNTGERPFLPEFGGGVRKLVFEPTGDVLRGMTKARLTQTINRWLGHRLTLEDLDVTFSGERVEISVRYRRAGSADTRLLKFQRSGV